MKKINWINFVFVFLLFVCIDVAQELNKSGVFANKYLFVLLLIGCVTIGYVAAYFDFYKKEKENGNKVKKIN